MRDMRMNNDRLNRNGKLKISDHRKLEFRKKASQINYTYNIFYFY